MATRGSAQLQNRLGNVGSSGASGNQRVLVDDDSSGSSQWLLAGMLFFAIVAFICLPIAAFILIEAKKTNVTAQAALAEAKKIRAELKPKKEQDDE
jgi:hypothetical protein